MKFDFQGVYFGCYALCDAIYTYFKTFKSLVKKTKKNSFGKTVLKIWSQICEKIKKKTKNDKTKNHKNIHNLCRPLGTKQVLFL